MLLSLSRYFHWMLCITIVKLSLYQAFPSFAKGGAPFMQLVPRTQINMWSRSCRLERNRCRSRIEARVTLSWMTRVLLAKPPLCSFPGRGAGSITYCVTIAINTLVAPPHVCMPECRCFRTLPQSLYRSIHTGKRKSELLSYLLRSIRYSKCFNWYKYRGRW